MLGRNIYLPKIVVSEASVDEQETERRRLISPQRPTFQTALEIIQAKECREKYFSEIDFEDGLISFFFEDGWFVHCEIKKFLSEPKRKLIPFETEEAAKEYFNKYKEGGEILESVLQRKLSVVEVQDLQDLLDREGVSQSSTFGAELDGELPNLILEVCGIIDGHGALALKVLNTIGTERTKFLQRRYQENWHFAAQMEYAMRSLSVDSPAYIAASFQYYSYITHELALAGYLLRDLEAIFYGTDQEYIKQSNREKFSGEKGTKGTEKFMYEKRRVLLRQMQDLLKREDKVIFTKIQDVEVLAKLAARHLERKKNVYWKDGGAGVVADHLSHIRSDKTEKIMKQDLAEIEETIKNRLSSKG